MSALPQMAPSAEDVPANSAAREGDNKPFAFRHFPPEVLKTRCARCI